MSSATTPSLPEAAQRYLAAGLCVLPARDKHPALWAWKEFRTRLPSQAEVQKWFAKPQDALCLVCGAVSGNLEILDFDFGAELFDPWLERVIEQAPDLPDRLVVESSPSGGRHVAYRCSAPVEGNLKLAARRVECPDAEPIVVAGKTCKPRQSADGRFFADLTLIETRGEGGLFLCAPSPGYELLSGDLARLGVLSADEREILLESARSLTEHWPEPAPAPSPAAGSRPGEGSRHANASDAPGSRPGDDFNRHGDIRPVLLKHGWTPIRAGDNEHWCRPGKTRGTSATLKDGVFYVFSSNAAPFEPATAYSKFAVLTLLEHGNDWSASAAALRSQGFGDEPPPPDDVDISALLPAEPKSEPSARASDDPGPLPDDLLRVPGFVSEVMDHCLETAPYPNPVMAFGGALSLQAFLAGRKVRDPGDNRTNLYLLGLAHSASGKDWPRKLNTRILHAVDLADCLGDRFASGEGLQDALFVNPSMLFQTDEIDGMLQSINKSKDARHESIMGTMLTLYSASNSVFPMRRLAGLQSRGAIDQPHLVVFGTAIPNHYYDSLSERMLTNGYFARNLVIESGPRAKGRDPRLLELPARLLDTARWWADLRPGTGNLEHWHPVPLIVELDAGAQALLTDARELVDREYERCERANDPVGTTVWGRAGEHIRKLALIHAISANHRSPLINRAAVDWAMRFVLHHVRRMLHMVTGHVASTPFDAECLKLTRLLLKAPDHTLQHSVLLKQSRLDAKTFREVITTMEQRGDIKILVVERTDTRAGTNPVYYRLLVAENDGNCDAKCDGEV